MGNQLAKGERILQAASDGDTQYIQQCMAEADAREKLLLKRTGFLHHNEGVLHLAAKHGRLHTITAVLGPIVDAVTVEIAEGHYPGKAAELLTKIVNQTDSRGRTALLTACYNGHWDCAEQLLEAGSNIFAVDKDGNGCLHLAAVNGHTDVVTQLLSKAEHEAVTLRLASILNLSGFTPLHYAAHAGNAEITRQLLAAGVDQLQGTLSDYDRWLVVLQGSTPLHIAAMSHQSGVCIMLLQHYVLQLREWLPGDPRPVDARTRVDNRGATPQQVALWKGLAPNSQLAVCLDPRFDIRSVFSVQQLDGVRRRGPLALKVLAAAALKGNLLQQLVGLKEHQQHLIMVRQWEQQQQRKAKQQQQQWRSRIQQWEQQQPQQQQQQRSRRQGEMDGHDDHHHWQRWWARRSLEADDHAAAAGSSELVQGSNGSGSSRQVFDSPLNKSTSQQAKSTDASSLRAEIGSSSSSSSSGRRRNNSDDDQVETYLHGLKRTPSITLGAMHYTHDTEQQEQQQQQQHTGNFQLGSGGAGQHHAAAAAAAATKWGEIEVYHAPAGPVTSNSQHSASSAAAAVTPAAGSSKLMAADHAPAGDFPPAVAAAAAAGSSHGGMPRIPSEQRLQMSSSITLGFLDQVMKHREQQQEDEQSQQPQQQQQRRRVGPLGADIVHDEQQQVQLPQQQHGEIEADVGSQQQQSRPQSGLNQSVPAELGTSTAPAAAAAAAAAASAADTYQHINEHIHKAVGCTKSFKLVTPSASGSSSSSDDEDGADRTAVNSQQQQQQQQQLVPMTPRQQQEPVKRKRPLGATSVTLAQLSRNNSASSLNGDMPSSSNTHSGGSRHGGNAHRIFATAGIQNEQVMTPFAFRLFQQQQKGYAAAAAAAGTTKASQSSISSSSTSPTGSQQPTAAASSSSSFGSKLKGLASLQSNSLRSSRPNSQSVSHFRSPHRRSFELPGSTGSSMSAVFGASRQHVARMLKEAGTVDPRSLYRTLSVKRGNMVVATSLAGALPGCVSIKLGQYVDLGRTSSLAFASRDLSATDQTLDISQQQQQQQQGAMDPSRASSIDVGGSVCSTAGEVCAICVDRPPAVAVSSCGHTMCFECVRVIVQEGVGCRAPLCPFCRVNMTGFKLVGAAAASQ